MKWLVLACSWLGGNKDCFESVSFLLKEVIKKVCSAGGAGAAGGGWAGMLGQGVARFSLVGGQAGGFACLWNINFWFSAAGGPVCGFILHTGRGNVCWSGLGKGSIGSILPGSWVLMHTWLGGVGWSVVPGSWVISTGTLKVT